MTKKLLILCFLFVVFCAQAQAASLCMPTTKNVQIHVKPMFPDTAINTSLSIEQLRGLTVKSGSPAPNNHQTVGFTLASPLVIETALRFRKDSSCTMLEAVDIVFGIAKADIYVANKFLDNACAYQAILTHEQTHVARDKQFIDEHTRFLQNHLYLLLDSLPILPASSAQSAQLEEAISNSMGSLLELLRARREAWQEPLDSEEEYAKLQNQCGGAFHQP